MRGRKKKVVVGGSGFGPAMGSLNYATLSRDPDGRNRAGKNTGSFLPDRYSSMTMCFRATLLQDSCRLTQWFQILFHPLQAGKKSIISSDIPSEQKGLLPVPASGIQKPAL
jgi:hypothetical protein